ncbi:MAG: hypothetical protein K6F67_00340 [Oscillospiraceae bacterium]|nr:hypothetical protein [Oscillospiraceae bacterium]
MTENEFRVLHSRLIEEYQLIEMRLKGICSAVLADERRNWIDRLDDYETDPLGKLLREISEKQKKNNAVYISPDDYKVLDMVRTSRNYWVHQCFSADKHVTFSRTGNVRREEYADRIEKDLNEAVRWDERLTEIFRELAKEKRIMDSIGP